MRVIQVNDVVQVRAWCTSQEQASVNTFYYGCTFDGGTPPTDQDLADDWSPDFAALFLPMLDPASTYNGIQVRIIVSGGIEINDAGVTSTIGNGAGSGTGVNQSRQTCGINTWLTAKIGPGNRGRTYWPFPAISSDVAGGVPSSAYLSAMTALCTFINDYDVVAGFTATLQQLLFRPAKPKNVPPIPFSDEDIVGFTVRGKWATQRRRGSYGRANISPV